MDSLNLTSLLLCAIFLILLLWNRAPYDLAEKLMHFTKRMLNYPPRLSPLALYSLIRQHHVSGAQRLIDLPKAQLDNLLKLCIIKARSEDPAALFMLATFYASGLEDIMTQDSIKARELFERSSSQGYAPAQYSLGTFYNHALGNLAQDELKALSYFRKSAVQGYAHAQYHLGILYLLGIGGLSKDNFQALNWFRKAARQGHKEAQYNLGIFHEKGLGDLEVNENIARQWYEKATQQGHISAQYNLGVFYVEGRGGLASNEEQARTLFESAAKKGHPLAQHMLGIIHPPYAGSGTVLRIFNLEMY